MGKQPVNFFTFGCESSAPFFFVIYNLVRWDGDSTIVICKDGKVTIDENKSTIMVRLINSAPEEASSLSSGVLTEQINVPY